MTDTSPLEIRESTPDDLNALEFLYPAAFPDEDLLPLVKALLHDVPGILSLVATLDSAVVGHIVFTPCRIADGPENVALLGPVAVAPDRQRRGVGTTLILAGRERLARAGVARIFTLGDPGYYALAGFAPELDVITPYPLPEEWRGAWQSMSLIEIPLKGALLVPGPWRRPALWAP
jgi:putative acetyltransferase